ncbi:hypothetical protein [Xanthomonas theicola]|uniref:RHS repeat protein n=1 Tax=Xanthomonas theicola TaxID=56464 RepID=A0A2S6YYV6_9XANT|nr:hypothetical protein [Xanthomonas theicola]PPT73279.1 hypothetical protein XthCFBP4691_20530 [Xanthomonas theicola]QNH23505.1 hypothetical protein G4Q83_21665 [Xanthomonas theicola]
MNEFKDRYGTEAKCYRTRLRAVPGKASYRYDGHGLRVNALDAAGAQLNAFYTRAGQLLYEERRGRGHAEYLYLAGSLLATRSNGNVDRPDFRRHSVAALRVAPFKLYR